MRKRSLQANVACGIDPSVTSNPASYPFSLQPSFFCWKFSCYHLSQLSCLHSIFFYFLQRIRHRLQEQVCKWAMVRQIPVCSFLLTVVLCVAGTQCLPFPRNINLKGTQSRNLSITCIMRPANRDIHAVKRRAAPQALGYRTWYPRCYCHTRTFHVYIVAVCYIIIMIISKIICIIAIICLTWKISEIICYNVSIFGREDTNYANYNKLLWQLSQRFCAKNNML